ncbi:hypothetical protein HOE22_09965 [Candidatus Woesearchaeota archaeon]|jgi:hypothetical protein|nr:hypothetical protein [bacterium]MBT4208652.1 hypothetical protein [Candidatus Woesearchaeota archaeon]MBT4732498.1 hypothetical protein [Candidatus Woesearchaeota archaeon]MBT7555532.1 hypothetical protein [Candidatus Woesearchaeota archaeon]
MKYVAMLFLLSVSVVFVSISSVSAFEYTDITVQSLDKRFATELVETEKKIAELEGKLYQLSTETDKEERKPLVKAWERLTYNRDFYRNWEQFSVKQKEDYLVEAERRAMNRLVQQMAPMELWSVLED